MDKVTVLMSTYNGIDYLDKQMTSILNQDGVDVRLVVRDDGSSDGTQEKITQYEKYSNVETYLETNIGWRNSFKRLLNELSGDSDYYAFADQDDVWESNKLYEAIKCLKNNNSVLYMSNMKVVNNQLEFIKMEYPEDFRPSKKFPESFFEGIGTGATLVMSKELRDVIVQSFVESNLAHDAYIVAVARLLFPEQVYYDAESYILYRRHGGNATGFGNADLSKVSLKQRYQRYKKNNNKPFTTRAKAIYKSYSADLSPKNRKILRTIANADDNFLSAVKVFFSPVYRTKGLRKTAQIKYRVLMRSL